MKTLNVKKVNKKEVEQKWGFSLPISLEFILYIRCNAKGDVNWEKAPIYKFTELIKRGNCVVY